ncbi:MAG: hypothetical protein ACRDD8_16070 [Bacteroidales bacterium]
MIVEIENRKIELTQREGEFNFIDFIGNMICYVNTKKYKPDSDEVFEIAGSDFNDHNIYFSIRTKIKPGRMLRKILGRELLQNEIESILSYLSKDLYEIHVVEGEDIRKYYDMDTYADDCGALNSSCMRYFSCQPFFNIYVNLAKMAVLRKVNDKNDVIYGRAILWDNLSFGIVDGNTFVEKSKEKLMDRIYCCTSKVGLFYDWARDNNYHRKISQGYGIGKIVKPNGDMFQLGYTDDIFVQKLDRLYEQYPYMDTLCSLSETNKEISSSSYLWEDRCLDSTDGNDDSYYCECCGEWFTSEECGHYVRDGQWICDDCIDEHYVWADDIGDYCTTDETYYCEECGTFKYYDNNVIYVEDASIWLCTDCSNDIVETEDGYYVEEPNFIVHYEGFEKLYFHTRTAFEEFYVEHENKIKSVEER